MANYATVQDVQDLFRMLTAAEQTRAEALIPVICSSLRAEAARVGKNLDTMVEEDPDLALVAKSVTVDVLARALMTSTDQEPMSQVTQAALGYSMSGTFLVPGGGLFIKKSELARLGLRRQRIGVIDWYGTDQRDTGCADY